VESDKLFGGGIDYAGIEDRYFVLALLPEKRDVSVRIERLGDEKNGIAKVVVSGSDGRVGGILFAGAKEHGTLQVYGRGLEDTLSLGFFGFLSVGFLVVLRWIYSWVANWGLAIIVLTAAIRVVLFPLNHKSAVAMKKMQALQPKLKAVQGRYQERAKKDVQVRNRMNQEVMQVYRQEGVNPMGVCRCWFSCRYSTRCTRCLATRLSSDRRLSFSGSRICR
jgi:YidC/Oxa1 family membrane protein insertase